METRQTTIEKKAEVVQNHADMPVDYAGYPTVPVGAEYPRDPVIIDHRDNQGVTTTTGKKPGLGQKIKNLFGGKKNKTAGHGHAGETVIEEHVHTKTTTTTLDQGAQYHQHQHLHGPLVANPYAQPAHGQIFVPANTAVQANPETGALLPASNLNGPVILPTGPKVIPIATNYPAGQAGPMVIPPSGGFINNSGNPYLTQQSYGPSGVIHETHVRETDYVDNKAAARLEKDEAKRMKEYEKEQKRLEKDEIKRQKALEKEAEAAQKSQLKLERQLEKDQAKMDKQLMKDQEKIAKDQQKLENTLEKDQAALANNQMKLQNNMVKNEAKLEERVAKDEMKLQETISKEAVAPQNVYANQQMYGAPLATGIDAGVHGVKHVVQEETKQDAYTGQVLEQNVFHKDTRF